MRLALPPIRAAALVLALALAGCAGSPPPPQRLYRLDTAPPAGARPAVPAVGATPAAPPADGTAPTARPAPVTAGVLSGRVALPEYLQRDAIVVADGARLQALDGERWAEPLRDALPRLLRADLEALRGPGSVWTSPVPAGVVASRTLRVEVAELQADDARRAVRLVARWTLEDTTGGAQPQAGSVALDEPVDGASVDALVAAHRRALWRLAQRIAGVSTAG